MPPAARASVPTVISQLSPSAPQVTTPSAAPTVIARRGLTRSSLDCDLARLRMLIHGQSGAGKSTMALSISDQWPQRQPGTIVQLTDTLVINADDDGLIGMGGLGVEVPEVIDLRWLMTPPVVGEDKPFAKTVMQALEMGIAETQAIVSEGKIKNVIVDSVSEIDRMMLKHFESPEYIPKDKNGNEDNFKLFRLVAAKHDWFMKSLAHLPVRIIYICHSRVLNEAVIADKDRDKEDKAKLLAHGLPGDNAVIPAITGQSLDVYQRNTSIIGAIVSTRGPKTSVTAAPEFKRIFYPYGGEMHRGKNRFSAFLSYEEPCDMQVIMGKIKSGLARCAVQGAPEVPQVSASSTTA